METERNPFKIPLILRTIFAHTSFSSLLQFRLVNSAWNFDATFVARKISSGKDSSVSPISVRRHWLEECQFYTKHFDKVFQGISEDVDTKLDEFNDCLRNSSIFEGAAWRNLTKLELGIVEDFHGTRYSNFDYDDGGFLDCEDEVDLNAALGGILPRPTSTWDYPLPEEFCSPSSLCGISDENEFQNQVEKLKEKKLRGSIDQLSQLAWLSIDLGNDHSKLVKLNFVGIFLACESLPNLSVKVNVAQKNQEEMRKNIFGQVQSSHFNSRVFVTSGEKMENLERNPRTCHNDPNFYYC